MAKDFATNATCTLKFDVMTNRDGNVAQPGETVAGKKSVTFGGFKSDITIDDAINTENSPALHNGVAGLMWLLRLEKRLLRFLRKIKIFLTSLVRTN